jgi:hypothetical protein
MSTAFDLKGCHDDPGCARQLIPGANGIGIWLWCDPCSYLVNVEQLHNSTTSRIVPVELASASREK